MSKIAVILPAHNEAANIAGVLREVRKTLPRAMVVVVDDCSGDRTAKEVGRFPKVKLLRSPINLGIGGAVQLGVQYALKQGCDLFVRMDADGQHDPSYLTQLIQRATPGKLIVGTRSPQNFADSSNTIRRLGSRYFSGLFQLFLQKSLPDPTSGYMCFGREIARHLAAFLPEDFPEIEMEVLLLRAGFQVEPVEVSMRSRQGGASSIDWLHSLVYVFSVTLAFFVSFTRKNPYRLRQS